MTREPKLARAIADQGFGEGPSDARLQDHMEQRDARHRRPLVPVLQDLLGLRAVKAKLTLTERTFVCDACGLVIDRDVNAARNLLALAASGAERLNACGGTVRPGLAGHGPSETGTRHRARG